MCHFLFLFSPKKLTVNVIGYLFQALSIFSFVCWAAPNNVVVNQLFGVRSGLGMSFLTFDWTQIAWIGSPLMFPWWAQLNTFVGFVLFVWILTPVLYYTNVSNTHTLHRYTHSNSLGTCPTSPYLAASPTTASVKPTISLAYSPVTTGSIQ